MIEAGAKYIIVNANAVKPTSTANPASFTSKHRVALASMIGTYQQRVWPTRIPTLN